MHVPINIAGGTYQHKSRPLSAQKTINFWPQIQDGAATSQYILESAPGLKSFSSGSGADRGMLSHRGTLYKVTGTTLESISSAGVRTTLGTIPGSSRCILDGMGVSVIVVSAGSVYEWDGSTLTEGTDADFESPDAVTVLNNQAIYDGNDGRFCSSDVGDPLSINGLNYATAESNADNLIRPYAFLQNVYMMGERTVEPWWNSGSGSPPFDRLEGGMIPVGLGALHSVAHNQNALYFLGNDRNVYRITGNGLESGFTPLPLVREFVRFSTVSDAIGWCINFQSRNFYFLKFPAENKTFVYPEGGQWFQLSTADYDVGSTPGRFRGHSYAFCYGKHLLADEDGNVQEWDDATYTDAGSVIKRVRDTAPIHGGLLEQPGKPIELRSFELVMETGVGLISGQGSDPKIMLSISTDGGRTFSTEMWGNVGSMGEFEKKVTWDALNVLADSIILRISTSDPVYYSLHTGGADIEIGI